MTRYQSEKTPVIILLCILLFGVNTWAQEFNDIDLKRKYGESVIQITVESVLRTGARRKFNGTGFIVHESGFVITTAEIIPDKKEYIDIIILGNKPGETPVFKLELIKREGELGLALLRLPPGERRFKGIYIGDSNSVLLRDEIIVLGCQERFLKKQNGFILNTFSQHGWFLSHLIGIAPSFSGAPVFNKKGEVIAVVTFAIRSAEIYLIPINFARGLLVLAGPPK